MTKLRISPDGRIRGLWDDEVRLGELGVMRVRRASHVEFDDRLQCWTVREPMRFNRRLFYRLIDNANNEVLHRTTTRAAALCVGARVLPTGWTWMARAVLIHITCSSCSSLSRLIFWPRFPPHIAIALHCMRTEHVWTTPECRWEHTPAACQDCVATASPFVAHSAIRCTSVHQYCGLADDPRRSKSWDRSLPEQ